MDQPEDIKQFYLDHLPGARIDGNLLTAPCPFCTPPDGEKPGVLVVVLSPDSFFLGYFRCLNRCRPGGFPLYFGRMAGIDPQKLPGHDPDREYFVHDIVYPAKNLNHEVVQYVHSMGESEYKYFQDFGVSRETLREMKIGFNGRYLTYPYFWDDGNCYVMRCVSPVKETDTFWHGNEAFTADEFRIFNVREIERCENGALFIADSEESLLTLKELGFPGIAVPGPADLEVLNTERLTYVNHIFLAVRNAPEAYLSARSLATRLGFKARILKWPPNRERGFNLCRLAKETGKKFRSAAAKMIKESAAFSPFSSPEKEHRLFADALAKEQERDLVGVKTGFDRLDRALNGVRGINIMGGQPKAGKSCFFMQVSTEMARLKTPVIYYDFENGRQKIYLRTLCRLSRLSEQQIRAKSADADARERLQAAMAELKEMLRYFRVVTERKLNPDIMRRQIDFLKHETRKDQAVIVIDSLHKLPFKDLSERRTGIDSWLRQMEAIRDEKNVSFMVVSELSRSGEGRYDGKPDMGSFKGSGDIEYSAENAMIFTPDWDPLDPVSTSNRKSTLWMVASRENNPGKIATYLLEYPLWGFKETD